MNDIAENETKRIFNNTSEILTTGNKSLEQYLEEINKLIYSTHLKTI